MKIQHRAVPAAGKSPSEPLTLSPSLKYLLFWLVIAKVCFASFFIEMKSCLDFLPGLLFLTVNFVRLIHVRVHSCAWYHCHSTPRYKYATIYTDDGLLSLFPILSWSNNAILVHICRCTARVLLLLLDLLTFYLEVDLLDQRLCQSSALVDIAKGFVKSSFINVRVCMSDKICHSTYWPSQGNANFSKYFLGVLVVVFSSGQLLSRVQLFATPWTAARQASVSITNSRSLPKLLSIESVMPSNHLILCHPLLLPSVFPNIRIFSNVLRIRWPKYWSFSFNISPSNETPRLISFRMDWLDFLAVVM